MHSLCSYFAMFPPQVPRVFIEWLTEPGDVVYDPFSGRGTTALEACRLGRVGYGADANPLAALLTAAKVDPPTTAHISRFIDALEATCEPGDAGEAPSEIQMLYAPEVLGQLLWLRERLDRGRRDERFLRAVLLGVMHANYTPGRTPRGLSISMPNTFSMSPGYVRGYIDEHELIPPRVNVFDLLRRRVDKMQLPAESAVRGAGWIHNAMEPVPSPLLRRPAKLIFTSPPYLSVIKYGKYNWVRLWLLNQDPKAVDDELMTTSSLSIYLAFMTTVVESLAPGLDPDGLLCLMIGDVRDRVSGETVNLADAVRAQVEAATDWRHVTTITDRVPITHKVSRIWKDSSGNATKTDRILILSRGRRRRHLPALKPLDWGASTAWA